ncbi:MAG TPA: hypothetical protein VF886_08015 [Roseiarcus sp.]
MKKAFLGLLLFAAWLASLPAHATTYTYDVNYSFTNVLGSVTGSITTSCDNCDLDASNILSWSFTASGGTMGRSSNPGSGISTTDFMLEATPTGIFTVGSATNGASIRFCSDISGGGADCFPVAGLDVYNLDHGGSMPPFWFIGWVEKSGAEATFLTDNGGFSPDPAIEIASLTTVPETPAWAMMIIGFAGFGFVALRRQRHVAKLRTT